MIALIDWHGRRLNVDYSQGRSIAIPLDPHGPQPAFFVDRPASAEALQSGDYIGSVKQGGSCNAEVIRFVPHCHGTHTEGVGHIHDHAAAVQDCIYSRPALARLVSVAGTPFSQSTEHYPSELTPEEPLITLTALQSALGADLSDWEALILRTLPNPADKTARDYSQQPVYPVLSTEALLWLAHSPLKHLLLDTPSLDRADDGGRLANHRLWWGLFCDDEEWELDPARRSVTEMVFVPDEIADGEYWLHLELSPIRSDATPSRPVLYPVSES